MSGVQTLVGFGQSNAWQEAAGVLNLTLLLDEMGLLT